MSTDIDLTRHVRTPAGVAYFHKPIGSPIGGGSGRGTMKVTAKAPAYVVEGKGYDEFGVAVKAADKLFDAPVSKTEARKVAVKEPGVVQAPPALATLKSRGRAQGAPSAEEAIKAAMNRNPHIGNTDLGDVISKASQVSPADMASAKEFWDTHKPSGAESESLATDLGLNPVHTDKSIKELRKAIRSRKTPDDERASMKVELAKRVAIAKVAAGSVPGFTSRLTKALDEKPEDADLAPVIGETLAEHPSLGPLAHIWDRLRITGYNIKKGLHKGEATDEIPRIIARNVAAVLITGLMIHFGMSIPGLGAGG